MKFTSVARTMSGAVAIAMLSSVVASAGTIRQAPSGSAGRHFAPTSVSNGVRPMTTCPSVFTGGCFEVAISSPISFEWCVSTSGNCSTGLVGVWTWTATNTTYPKGKPAKPKKFQGTWSPNPGNPSVLTLHVSKGKNSKGKIKFANSNTTCSSTYGCFSDFVVYGISIL
jgi:hypothetical protein